MSAPSINIGHAVSLPPEKAIEYFRSKGMRISWNWQDTWQEAHAKAFTVAKVAKMDVLTAIRSEVDRALATGMTEREFMRTLAPRLKQMGWWGRQEIEGKMVQLGSTRRLQTIYRTNLQTAYMAGRFKAFQENADHRPYLMYVAIMDGRTRPSHLAMNGRVFHIKDPIWKSHCPPLAFNCRCRVRALSESAVQRMGLSVESSSGKLSEEMRLAGINRESGEQTMRPVTVFRSVVNGRTQHISPDVGWSYNPGLAAWQPDLDRYPFDVAKQYLEGAITGPDFTRFFKGKIGGNFPVAVLNPKSQIEIASKTKMVVLSQETLLKNLKHHPEVTLHNYQQIQTVIHDAQVVVEKEGRILIFMQQRDDLYFAVVKRTGDGKELYLTSFRQTRLEDARREMARGKVIRNDLGL